ncbi:hypothetical protein [Pseudoalteromonas umbrosa]|uniref:hypothetical protein n=1 Tax=Pseudoalteromonas umbrosa TaxID=3048489 RepID=UPI0024C3732F|nr:hypothetical protein [Pseudoalteromonas sp. B95]MDK1290060.1 hypothetical protein [Pseudoalteromonas sp. B95]
MFETWLSLVNIIDTVDNIIVGALAASLIISWKNIAARWLLMIYFLLEWADLILSDWSRTMPIGFYAWCMLLCVVFAAVIWWRHLIAYRFRQFEFFKQVYLQHKYTQLDKRLIYIFAFTFVVNLVTLIEVYLYSIWVLQDAWFKLNVRDVLHNAAQIAVSLVCLHYAYYARRY